MSGSVRVKFNNQAVELIHIYKQHESIVKYLSKNNDVICPLINDTKVIKIDQELGSGISGTVYSITIEGEQTNKKYVLKTGGFFSITSECLETEEEARYNLGSKSYVIEPPYYLCDESQKRYSEYLIGLLVSNFYKCGSVQPVHTGRKVKQNQKVIPYCINFTNILNLTTCYKPKRKQYIFMERIDDTLNNIIYNKQLESYDLISIIIQLLFSIHLYQTHYKISHNDLHYENIFVEEITEDTEYMGKKLIDYKYMQYKIGDFEIYAPIRKGGWLVKLGDWDQSCKYSKPAIIREHLDDRIPKWFEPAFDTITSLLFIRYSLSLFQKYIISRDLINYILEDVCKVESTDFDHEYYRPYLNSLIKKQFPSAQTILKKLKDSKFYKIHDVNKRKKYEYICLGMI